MGELLFFLFSAVVISLSGVLAPGPMTAAALAVGSRSPHAGAMMAVGHGIVELPLILLIVGGMNRLFQSASVQTVIGLAGGAVLLFMAFQMLRSIKKAADPSQTPKDKSPLLTGIVLSAGNPYFLLWWATVGLALATKAGNLGILAFALFAIIHWMCDLIWLETLSWASFKGSNLFGRRSQKMVLLICGTALLFFGLKFIYDAAANLI